MVVTKCKDLRIYNAFLMILTILMISKISKGLAMISKKQIAKPKEFIRLFDLEIDCLRNPKERH